MDEFIHNRQGLPQEEKNSNSIDLDELLDLSIQNKASDIHFAAGERIALRINGKITFLEGNKVLTDQQAQDLVHAIVQNPLHRERIEKVRELDISFRHKDGSNFRVNVYFKRKKIACVLRHIGNKAPTLEEIGLPSSVENLLQRKQGLILVTGPTGSGKSTTMQAMLEYINMHRVEHVITVEDPIEFVFESKKSIFSQREIGEDTLSFSNALRSALREDPDVIMIGELRDPETISTAMSLAETGHLVISTLHTSGAPQTVQRIVNAFPAEHHHQIQARLADTLIGVVSQRLIPRIDIDGRIGIFEIMIVNGGIRNVIRTGEFQQLYNAILGGRSEGMITMQDYANHLTDEGIIEEKDVIQFFQEE